jgi:hypothetical protein
MTAPFAPSGFDRAGAKRAGYSDAEIDAFLSAQSSNAAPPRTTPPAGNDERARLTAAGFSPAEIDTHYSNTTPPRGSFREYAEGMRDPRREAMADRWDELVKAGTTADAATQQVQREFTQRDLARRGEARRGPATAASQLMQGASFGFSDEANAGMSALGAKLGGDSRPVRDVYAERVAEERARQAAYSAANPGKSLMLQLAGGLVSGGAGAARVAAVRGAGAAAAAAPSMLARAGTVLGAGAGMGALGAAGASEAPTLGGVAADAALGGALGAGFAGAAPIVGKVAGTVAPVARAAVGAVRTPTTALRTAEDVGESALLRLAKALQQDKVTPDALRTAGASARPGEIVADLAGPQTQRLVRGSEAVPSAGASTIRRTLADRQAEQGDRVTSALVSAFGADDAPDLVSAARRLEQTRKAASGRAYREAYEVAPGEPRTVSASLLTPYLDDPVFRRAMTKAREQFDLDVRTGDAPTRAPIFRDVVESVGADGTPVITTAEEIPVAVVDYLKRGLDAVIESGADGRPLDRAAARSYRTLRNRLLESVDAEVPEFAAARQVYAGGMALEEALQRGQDAMRRGTTRADLRATLADLSDGEAEQFRLGALGQLLEDVANTAEGRDVARTIAKSPAMREKLDILLPTDAARDEFAALLQSEARMTATGRTIQGSRTAPTLQDVDGLTDTGGAGWLTGALTAPRQTAMRAAGAVADRVMRADRTRMADELAPLLTTPAGQVEKVVELLARAQSKRAARTTTARGAVGGVAGATAGQVVRP